MGRVAGVNATPAPLIRGRPLGSHSTDRLVVKGRRIRLGDRRATVAVHDLAGRQAGRITGPSRRCSPLGRACDSDASSSSACKTGITPSGAGRGGDRTLGCSMSRATRIRSGRRSSASRAASRAGACRASRATVPRHTRRDSGSSDPRSRPSGRRCRRVSAAVRPPAARAAAPPRGSSRGPRRGTDPHAGSRRQNRAERLAVAGHDPIGAGDQPGASSTGLGGHAVAGEASAHRSEYAGATEPPGTLVRREIPYKRRLGARRGVRSPGRR